MLTADIPRLYTGKIFAPQIPVHNALIKFNLAAVRKNGITANVILSPGDTFAELRIKGLGGDYFMPIDLWDLYQLLTQSGSPSSVLYWTARGADVLERLKKVGVNLARYEALRLTKKIPYWPKNDLIQACLTHRSQLLERANELINENFYDLSFVDLILNIPGGLVRAAFRFSQTQVTLSDRLGQQEAQISIKVDYELEPVTVKTEEMILA